MRELIIFGILVIAKVTFAAPTCEAVLKQLLSESELSDSKGLKSTTQTYTYNWGDIVKSVKVARDSASKVKVDVTPTPAQTQRVKEFETEIASLQSAVEVEWDKSSKENDAFNFAKKYRLSYRAPKTNQDNKSSTAERKLGDKRSELAAYLSQQNLSLGYGWSLGSKMKAELQKEIDAGPIAQVFETLKSSDRPNFDDQVEVFESYDFNKEISKTLETLGAQKEIAMDLIDNKKSFEGALKDKNALRSLNVKEIRDRLAEINADLAKIGNPTAISKAMAYYEKLSGPSVFAIRKKGQIDSIVISGEGLARNIGFKDKMFKCREGLLVEVKGSEFYDDTQHWNVQTESSCRLSNCKKYFNLENTGKVDPSTGVQRRN